MFHIPAHKNVANPAGQVSNPLPTRTEGYGSVSRGHPSLDKIIAYEEGNMTEEEIVEFFRDGVQSGWVWTLQGSYGRMARRLMEQGLI